jgi:hypothetical protein
VPPPPLLLLPLMPRQLLLPVLQHWSLLLLMVQHLWPVGPQPVRVVPLPQLPLVLLLQLPPQHPPFALPAPAMQAGGCQGDVSPVVLPAVQSHPLQAPRQQQWLAR